MTYKQIHRRFRKSNTYLLTLVLIGLLFLISNVGAEDTTNRSNTSTDATPVTIVTPASTQSVDFKTLFSDDKEFNSYTIELNGITYTVIELDPNSAAVSLPDDNIGLRFYDGTTAVLPNDSYFSNEDISIVTSSSVAISIPSEKTIIGTPTVLSLDVASIATDSTYSQSVDKLDEYKIRVEVKELENENTSILITSYTIDWGDGTTESYSSDQKSIEHIYSKSGDYEQTYYVTDSFGTTWSVENDLTVENEGPLIRFGLWARDRPENAVATTTGFSMLAIGLIAATETGKYKLLLAFLALGLPLYTRIQKEDVLDQFVRGQIYGYIKTNPGVHYNQIRRGMGIKNGTLSYHLSVLEKTELIKSRREGLKYRAFYPTGMKFPQNERFRLTDLQIRILNIIKENEGINQKEIAKKLDKKPQTINYNIKVLEQADLIEVVKRGRKTICYHKEPEYSDQPAG